VNHQIFERNISEANSEVTEVIREVELTSESNIDDVTESVSATAIETLDDTVKARRVVRKRQKAPFRAYLVKIGKAKFGCPRRNEANLMCVRKFLYDACVSHGVLARHINENLDFAVEMVFIPTKSDMIRMAMRKTAAVSDCTKVAALLGSDVGDN
jgi:hypothetical protein